MHNERPDPIAQGSDKGWLENSACLGVKNIGKPCALIAHARFDEGGQARACPLLYLFFEQKRGRFGRFPFLLFYFIQLNSTDAQIKQNCICRYSASHHPAWKPESSVFFTDDDRNVYLSWLKAYCDKHGVDILAYCLMTNHIHLVAVPETEEGLQRVLKPLHMRYAQEKRVAFQCH